MSENYIMIMMVLGVLSFDTSNPHLQHFSVHASDRGRLNHIARSNGCGPENHRGNFGGFDGKTIFNCNVTFSEPVWLGAFCSSPQLLAAPSIS